MIFIGTSFIELLIQLLSLNYFIFLCFLIVIFGFFFLFQLNISYPATGCQKLIEIDDEKKLRMFYEKRMGHEVEADGLGDEWKVC